MAYVIQNRLRELMAEKSRREQRKINQARLIEETGLSRQTVVQWANNRITRVDYDTLLTLCTYFDCQPGDLLVKEDVEAPPDDALGQRTTPLLTA